MAKIEEILVSPGLAGFFFDDQRAIKEDAEPDGAAYRGKPKTDGFTQVRQAGESILIEILLSDGSVARGDCAAVQYSGTGGRDPLFLSEEFIPVIKNHVRPELLGREAENFGELAALVEEMTVEGRQLHTALRYGFSQALLDAAALSRGITRSEVLLDEYDLTPILEPVDIFVQTGDNRYENADKAIIKRADVLPHGLINNIKRKLGEKGEKLLDYIKWLKKRVRQLGSENYNPVFHIDVYGTLGEAFAGDLEAICEFLCEAERAADPYQLRIEGPIDAGNRRDQVKKLSRLRRLIDESGCGVEIVADEWCNKLDDIMLFADERAGHMVQIKTPDLGGIQNTVRAILYCRSRGLLAYQGGTCNETDISARICTDAALAARPEQILAKPGMGLDEGLMIVKNQMQRTLTRMDFNRQSRSGKGKESGAVD